MIDGRQLCNTGRGISSLTIRELCNLAYARIIDEMTLTFRAQVAAGAQFEGSDPLGEKITRFEEQVGLRVNPADIALEMHKQWMAQQGKEWDTTPVTNDDRWWDKDIEFSGMDALNKALTKEG